MCLIYHPYLFCFYIYNVCFHLCFLWSCKVWMCETSNNAIIIIIILFGIPPYCILRVIDHCCLVLWLMYFPWIVMQQKLPLYTLRMSMCGLKCVCQKLSFSHLLLFLSFSTSSVCRLQAWIHFLALISSKIFFIQNLKRIVF